ncbi:hypothetical protein [uncultured Nonlabens sp.]|uniref:hypothetical protein n=1 Tax=uncultured Nonlabens sp. TaxID=859306 RepID=UPI0026257EFD|nr:hypothetical protein [uncultured Nonlabens sp.]
MQLPKGIKRHIDRLPKKILKKIDKNVSLAKEKCLILSSALTHTVFYENELEQWKSLSSEVMHKQFKKGKDNTYVYKRIIDALTYNTKTTSPVLECFKNRLGKDSYLKNYYSKLYRYHISKRNKKLVQYKLQFEENIQKRRIFFSEQLSIATGNVICKNLIHVYSKISLPTVVEIESQGKALEKQKYRNKKGKLLTRLKGKSKEYYANHEERSFVEDNIKQFNYLTKLGFIIPKIGDSKSGGRVVDSFNLMPS